MSEGPHGEEVLSLSFTEKNGVTSIEETKVSSSISYNSEYGYSKSSVESHGSITLEYFDETVSQSVELSVASGLTDVDGEPGSGEVERVDNAERGGSGGTSGHDVSNEEFAWLGLLVVWVQVCLEGVLEGEVQCLSWEVPEDDG